MLHGGLQAQKKEAEWALDWAGGLGILWAGGGRAVVAPVAGQPEFFKFQGGPGLAKKEAPVCASSPHVLWGSCLGGNGPGPVLKPKKEAAACGSQERGFWGPCN